MKPILAAGLLLGSLCAQQDILHYTFDATDADEVMNFARGPLAAPTFGTTSWPASYTYTNGHFGAGALAASPMAGSSGRIVRTGWHGPHQGALTIAFFLRNAHANGSSIYSPIAGQPSWSIATGGSAGAGLQLRGWGGADLNGDFGVALCSLPGWNHFAIVVDPAAGQATWYHNGAAGTTAPIGGGAALGAGELLVGTDWLTVCGGLYDIDEFVMLGRAAAPAEIAQMAQAPLAAARPFGTTSTVSITANSLPAAGNTTFALDVTGPHGTVFVLAAGFSHAYAGSLPLPLDLGAYVPGAAGQLLRTSPDASAAGVLAAGHTSFVLPIPNVSWLLGAQWFTQPIAVTGGTLTAGNALALRVGRSHL